MKSKLTTVTFTGADDTVRPAQLVAMSANWLDAGFDVEWGILIGSSHGHRFPSVEWINELVSFARPKVKLSLHICGKHLRGIAAGMPLQVPPDVLAKFQRCQLNWHGEQQGEIEANVVSAFKKMAGEWAPEVIFQLDGRNDMLPIRAQTIWLGKISGLFDLSHGAGVLPDAWPEASLPSKAFKIGYAGGLGPENMKEQLPKIHAAARGEYWIDMETKLFDGQQFDLFRCEQVLDIVKHFTDPNP